MTQQKTITGVTTDHRLIRDWVKQQGGRPALLASSDETLGKPHIDFGQKREDMEHVPWERFFEAFESHGLALSHDPEAGEKNYQFTSRNTESPPTFRE
jgi:hypothetical protein